MKPFFSEKLKNLNLSSPLYAVGGCVRNALLGLAESADTDLAGDLSVNEMKAAVLSAGFTVKAEYPRTETLLFTDGSGASFEFTSFRRERYAPGGGHAPVSVERTSDLAEDARRRDFTCNAVYYDLARGTWEDPLGGRAAIERKSLETCRAPGEVFASDGLRLLRLCRFAAELGFTPSADTLAGARRYAENIRDIAAERIYAELLKILAAPERYPFSPEDGALRGLVLCEEIGVFALLFPELAAGRGMAQRADFHAYDVLDHSFRAVLYAPPHIRLAALLHDVGKPACYLETGRFYGHAERGARIAEEILTRLKAPRAVCRHTARLTALHMLDLDGQMRESKVRRAIRDNAYVFWDLMALKQADYAACKDDPSVAPAVARWTEIFGAMKRQGVPFSPKELAVNGADLAALGFSGAEVKAEIERLMDLALAEPAKNAKESLLAQAKEDLCRLKS